MKTKIKPLYRKRSKDKDRICPQSKWDRNTKKGIRKSLASKRWDDFDYTPLYNYLLTQIGEDFNVIHSYVQKRVNNINRIYDIIKPSTYKLSYVRVSENAYYSALYIDEYNTLKKINPNFNIEHMYPFCSCCTHTFNNKIVTNVCTWDKLTGRMLVSS